MTPPDPPIGAANDRFSALAGALTAALAERYRLERELGSGGMATVFLAQDLRHDRQVAIKVLHPELSAVLGPERFLAEIKTTASLQHPHILPLFDSGSADGQLYYVMPYVEGETLRGRLQRERQLPVSDALRIATEVASALDYAHRHGVIHRDIKPENILLHDGSALVADFGIALAVQQAGGTRMTQTGLSLGTPQYMAPEQAMGERNVDARADIYAVGAVLYEMLAGEPPFTGPNAQAIVARVLTERPRALETLRDTVPASVAEAVHVALAKLPADRFARAAELAAALGAESTGARPTGTRARPAASRAWLEPRRLIALGATALVAFAAGWLVHASVSASGVAAPPVRRVILPMSAEFDVRGADMAVSSNGRTLALTDGNRLVIRRVDRIEPIVLAGAGRPFLSADGSRVGFGNGRSVVVREIDGGVPTTFVAPSLTDAAFLDADRLVAIDSDGLVVMNLNGGDREVIAPAPDGTIFLQPLVLPGGKRVLLTAARGELGASRILSVDLASHRVDTVPLGPALRPQYARGWLYFARPNGLLFGVRIDATSARVQGEPVALRGEQVVVARQGRVAYAAGDGLLAIGGRPQNRLVALGANGHREVLLDQLGTYHNPRVSPDGRQILVDRDEGALGGRDVWILDLPTRTLTRATTVGDAHDAVWAPDGRHLTYLSFSTKGGPIVTSAADGSREQRLVSARGTINPGAWLPDGSAYIAGLGAELNNSDLVAISAADDRRDSIVVSRFDEHSPAVSPDGRWLAYTSNETGERQIYVRSLAGSGRALVSVRNGEEAVWSRDGRELLYIEHEGDSSRVIAARLEGGAMPRVASRTLIVPDLRYEPVGNHANWDVMPDGRLVFVEPVMGTQIEMIFDPAPPGGR